MRGGVGVAADNRHAGLGETQLGADNVNDALIGVTQGMQAHAELLRVLAQRVDLRAARDVRNGLVNVDGRRVVILRRDRQVGAANLTPRQTQALEGLGACDLMHQVEVDVQQVGGSVLTLGDDVVTPHLFGHRSTHCSSSGLPFGDTVSVMLRTQSKRFDRVSTSPISRLGRSFDMFHYLTVCHLNK